VTGRLRADRGQAAVELALSLPLLAGLALLLVQVGLVVRDHVVVTAAAREAVREAAVSPEPGAARRAALSGTRLAPDRLTVAVHGRGGPGSRVTVEVRYRAPTDVPVVGRLLGDVHITRKAAMRVEQ